MPAPEARRARTGPHVVVRPAHAGHLSPYPGASILPPRARKASAVQGIRPTSGDLPAAHAHGRASAAGPCRGGAARLPEMRHPGAWLRALAMRRLRVTPGCYEYRGAIATATGTKAPLFPWDRSPDAEVRPRGLKHLWSLPSRSETAEFAGRSSRPLDFLATDRSGSRWSALLIIPGLTSECAFSNSSRRLISSRLTTSPVCS